MITVRRNPISFVQIEITTVCNFSCFYCAGRSMPQRHMDRKVFDFILASLPAGQCTVSLQGEGEPALHPEFVAMAKQVATAGKIPYTITNCTRIDTDSTAELFPQIGVSLDTLDPVEAKRIGRHALRQTLTNLDRLIQRMGPDRIVVHSVFYGQPMEQLLQFVQESGLASRHVIQPLQSKDDYRQRYPEHFHKSDTPVYHFRCRYLLKPVMRYFDVAGRELPCRFIKDTSKFISKEHTGSEMRRGQLPDCCSGCREIMMGGK